MSLRVKHVAAIKPISNPSYYLQSDILEFAVNHGGSLEVRGGLSDERFAHFASVTVV